MFFVGAIAVYTTMLWLINRQQVTLELILKKIAEQNAATKQMSSLSLVVSESEQNREQLSRTVIHGEDGIVDFLAQVDATAAAAGVELETSELRAEKEEDKLFGRLTVTLNVEGSPASVERFMRMIELFPYAHKILSYRISENLTPEGLVATGVIKLSIIMQ